MPSSSPVMTVPTTFPRCVSGQGGSRWNDVLRQRRGKADHQARGEQGTDARGDAAE